MPSSFPLFLAMTGAGDSSERRSQQRPRESTEKGSQLSLVPRMLPWQVSHCTVHSLCVR